MIRLGTGAENPLEFRVVAVGGLIPQDMRTWLSGRASPCQGEGSGFESRRPLGEVSAEASRGGVAERRGSGLQSRVHGFKSRLHLCVMFGSGD